MSELETKLTDCFTNVFPNIPKSEIPRANAASLAAWDSIAQVTLLSSISEQFGVDFEIDDFAELVSYALVLDSLERKIHINGKT